MSSESSLWDYIRGAIGHRGHFTRIEFNPEAGVPDVDFCIKGSDGKIELKHAHAAPARSTSKVFGEHGLRTSQITWIFTRRRHGGNVWILAQVGRSFYLVCGDYARTFNQMTLHQIAKASSWSADAPIAQEDWELLLTTLRRTK